MPVDLSGLCLYGIVDLSYLERGAMRRAMEGMIAGGVDIIQLRAKGRNLSEVAGIAA